VPSTDEVARRAYSAYVNEGSPLGRHVQHWLDAEAQLIAERNLTRVHGFATDRNAIVATCKLRSFEYEVHREADAAAP